jgi:hypothetical protein
LQRLARSWNGLAVLVELRSQPQASWEDPWCTRRSGVPTRPNPDGDLPGDDATRLLRLGVRSPPPKFQMKYEGGRGVHHGL